MRSSEMTAVLPAEIETVWNIVTDNSNYTWRSDLERIEQTSPDSFIEYGKSGSQITFKITEKKQPFRYAFYMQHSQFNGTWSGTFEATGDGKTTACFREELTFRHKWVELLSYFMMNLKQQQIRYFEDLRREIHIR